MRRSLACLVALVLSACASPVAPGPGPAPAPSPNPTPALFRVVAKINGEADVTAYAGEIPLLTAVRAHGNGSMTIKTAPPWVTFDGELIVEPLPGREARVHQAIASGGLLVRTPLGLRPSGSIDAALRGGAPLGEAPPPPPPAAPSSFPPSAPPTQDGGAGAP